MATPVQRTCAAPGCDAKFTGRRNRTTCSPRCRTRLYRHRQESPAPAKVDPPAKVRELASPLAAELADLAPSVAIAALEASVCRASFADFVAGAWPVIEPTRPLIPSVAVDGLVAVLQEAGDHGGRWAISCPPGVGKSLIASVCFPAWLLLRSEGRARIMAGSYSWSFAERDSRRCRDLVRSEWFQSLIGGTWQINPEADRLDDWSTTATGRRLITSPSGKATGERVTVQLIDDAMNADDAWSDAIRERTARWLRQTLPSRLDKPAEATRIIIGQRLHPADPIGVMLELEGWQHLRLPAIATEEPCELRRADGSLIWCDPRAPGEPLFADHTREVLAELKVEHGSAAFAAQYQQAPVDESAAIFRRSWFRRWTELPDSFDRYVITLDASFKDAASSDYAVIQAWGAKGPERYLLEQWRRQAGFVDTLVALRAIARRYPFARIVIEEGANGFAVIDSLKRQIPAVFGVKPEGGKVARAASVQAIVESGVVLIPAAAPWADAWLDEVTGFPGVKHDDQCDAMVYALRELQREPAIVRAEYIPRHNDRRSTYRGPTDDFGRPMQLH